MDFDKLGAFFLGREVTESGESTKNPILYDSRDLTTHALCVGMTGSGKTGLSIGLLEEAALDGIPAIAIDPKGDLSNLALTFPNLSAAEFKPWIDEGEAQRKERTVDEHAEKTAESWKRGLADWGQGAERVKRFRDAVDLTIYTPGSRSGVPLSPLKSLSPHNVSPHGGADDNPEDQADRVSSAVSGLLTLVDVDADPLKSREHILLSQIIAHAWQAGKSVDLTTLIGSIENPEIERVGVVDLDTFYPPKERHKLAMAFNNLVASPSFAAWLEGDGIDISALLRTKEGKPRLSIISIAHLSEAERMFFVTLLLNEVVAWMRTQAGTSSLRALIYMDEVFGYFPPTQNPPSKRPMLTLLKQARAYGVGVMLATQNPVDLDYKGLSNCGTWFLGRLQTERDVNRVIDGLKGAAEAGGKSLDTGALAKMLAGLQSRRFLMNNVHDDGPVLFDTRWVLSYLRGPLTRKQIQVLMADKKKERAAAESVDASRPSLTGGTPPAAAPSAEQARPVLPPDVPQTFLSAVVPGPVTYRPGVIAEAKLHYSHANANIDTWLTRLLVNENPGEPSALDATHLLEDHQLDLTDEPNADASFATPPSQITTAQKLNRVHKSFKAHLYQSQTVTIGYCRPHKLWSGFDESRADFVARVEQVDREKRDAALSKLQTKYQREQGKLLERIRKAEQKLDKEKTQYEQKKMDTAISVGSTVLGALFGRKATRGATSAARGAGRAYKERGDIERATQDLAKAQANLVELEVEFEAELTSIRENAEASPIEQKIVRPKKADIEITNLSVLWLPWVEQEGSWTPGWTTD